MNIVEVRQTRNQSFCVSLIGGRIATPPQTQESALALISIVGSETRLPLGECLTAESMSEIGLFAPFAKEVSRMRGTRPFPGASNNS